MYAEWNVVPLNIWLSQGSAATECRCGGRFYFTVFRRLSTNPKVKELLKSVHICQSYRKNKSGTFFDGTRCILVRHSNLGPTLHRSFRRYCSFFVLLTPPLFHPNFGGVLVAPDRMLLENGVLLDLLWGSTNVGQLPQAIVATCLPILPVVLNFVKCENVDEPVSGICPVQQLTNAYFCPKSITHVSP